MAGLKLYYHKTDGGAEYLTDKYIEYEYDGKKGKEGIVKGASVVVRIDGDIEEDAEISFNLTDKQFIDNADEDEVLSVIEGFLNRARNKGLLNKYHLVNDELVITDKNRAEIVREMKADFKAYLK